MCRIILLSLFSFYFFSSLHGQCLAGNCQNGQSTYKFKNGAVYEGQMLYGKLHGIGTLTYANRDVYKGHWKMNKREGEGILNTHDGLSFQGAFVNHQLHGLVRVYDKIGGRFEGQWTNGTNNHLGLYTNMSGEKIEGYWSDAGFRKASEEQTTIPIEFLVDCNLVPCGSGKGRMVFDDGSVYTGFFLNGWPDGEGVCHYINGEVYKGDWIKGRPDGRGEYRYTNGIILNGEWKDGQFMDKEEVTKPAYAEGINIYALIVGASRYDHFESLKYTDDDAYRIYAFLRSPEGGAVPDDHIRVLIDESAVAENIYKSLDDIMAMAGTEDVVLVYLAGHGLQGFFVPTDSDGYRNRVEYETLKAKLATCHARQKLVMADACYAGSLLAAKSPMFESVDLFYKKLSASGGGTAFLLSSKSEEYSLESQGLRQGIFSHYLIGGLKGDADVNDDKLVTLDELYTYVYQHVRAYSGNLQTPVLAGNMDRGMPLASVR